MDQLAANPPHAVPRRPLREDLRIAAVLAVSCAFANAALFPYVLELMPELRAKLTVPLAVVIPLQALQGGILLGIVAFVGLRLGQRAGLDAPWLRALVTRRPRPIVPWARSLLVGFIVGAVMTQILLLVDPYLPPPLHPLPKIGAWNGLLASFYGGIGEEVLLRLLVMTLLVWLVARLRRRPPGAALYWSAVVVAALLFGAGHLPAAAGFFPLTPVVVLDFVLVNALGGVVFGWLYWRHGLEAAMCAHFGADLALHVAAPLLMG